jgi:hypothetical protein
MLVWYKRSSHLFLSVLAGQAGFVILFDPNVEIMIGYVLVGQNKRSQTLVRVFLLWLETSNSADHLKMFPSLIYDGLAWRESLSDYGIGTFGIHPDGSIGQSHNHGHALTIAREFVDS